MIVEAMARAFFACAYSDQAEETGNPIQGKIMDQLPADIDPAAISAANTLKMNLEHVHRVGLEDMTADLTDSDFGHYAAMQAMGHGVGLWEFDGFDSFEVPYVEFGSYSLEKDYFSHVSDV